MAMMLDYTQQGVTVRTMVDGVWIPRETSERESGDLALEALTLLFCLNPTDRQSRPPWIFTSDYESIRYAAAFSSQGTPCS